MATERNISQSKQSSGGIASYRIPGECTHGDMVLQKPFFDPAVLVRMPNVRMDSSDVLLASYPKSGWRYDCVYTVILNLTEWKRATKVFD